MYILWYVGRLVTCTWLLIKLTDFWRTLKHGCHSYYWNIRALMFHQWNLLTLWKSKIHFNLWCIVRTHCKANDYLVTNSATANLVKMQSILVKCQLDYLKSVLMKLGNENPILDSESHKCLGLTLLVEVQLKWKHSKVYQVCLIYRE